MAQIKDGARRQARLAAEEQALRDRIAARQKPEPAEPPKREGTAKREKAAKPD